MRHRDEQTDRVADRQGTTEGRVSQMHQLHKLYQLQMGLFVNIIYAQAQNYVQHVHA